MTIHQLSVFIENKSGTLMKALKVLKNENIQLIATTIADTADYGIWRIICHEPLKAYKALKEAEVAVSLCDVFAIELDDQPGQAAQVISCFANEGISIAYLYSFLLGGKGVLIFRTDNPDKARDVIVKNNLNFIAEDNLSKLL